MEFHDVLRVRILHKPGYLAKLCAAVADVGAMIGDIETVATGGDNSVRDITLEAKDEQTIDRVVEKIKSIAGLDVLSRVDRVFDRHRGGKIQVKSRVPLEKIADLRQIYTPGVARVCRAIQKEPALSRELTWAGRTVAICTNGTRVLGLGDIGVLASLPVMEGKAVLYDRCIGLSAVPILVEAKDAPTFIATVERIAKSFGGIHLEDISAPECFEIEAELDRRLDIPVMHDDRHGTAVAALAAIMGACAQLGRPLERQTIGQIGLGAAGFGIACLARKARAKAVLATDPDPLAQTHADANGIEIADFETVMARADIVVAATGRPGLIGSEMIRKGQVVFALTNPEPEIQPQVALRAGAAFAADGASVNNVLAFPGIFLGALSCGARTISTVMKLAAAQAIVKLTRQSELVPDPLDPAVHRAVATAVAGAARGEGLDRPDRVPPGLTLR